MLGQKIILRYVVKSREAIPVADRLHRLEPEDHAVRFPEKFHKSPANNGSCQSIEEQAEITGPWEEL